MPASGPGDASTRERLLAAGLRLFAERGYDKVGVGDVEAAVGLAPRRGALYRHFASKEALLAAATRSAMDSFERAGQDFESLEGDLTEQAIALGRRTLQELDATHDITRVLEREGDRLPGMRDEFRAKVADRGYAIVATILRSWLTKATADLAHDQNPADEPDVDLDATAVLLAGALVNVRRATWTFGQPPAGLDDAALVDAWARLCVATVTAAVRPT